jgi:signal transduction histidine kinase
MSRLGTAENEDQQAPKRTLRVLFVEDSPQDVELVVHQLRRAGYEVIDRRVETSDELAAALQSEWDVVLSDYNMPRFRGDLALEMVRSVKGPDVPFIVVSGTLGDERAVALLKAGANDFVIKANYARLIPTIDRELKDAQLRKERREAVEAMRRAIEARDEFISIASHELRTPLTSLMLQVESLSRLIQAEGEDQTHPVVNSKLDVISRQTNRLATLIDGLLDISRITTNRLEIHRVEVDLSRLIEESIQHVSTLAANAKSELRPDIPHSCIGQCDRDRVETVIVNLLSNAIKYGNGKPIDVALKRVDHTAIVTVQDQGIGIAPEDQERIFGRFERAVSSRHFGGFGVGLWLSRQIIEAHGGSIRVRSEP